MEALFSEPWCSKEASQWANSRRRWLLLFLHWLGSQVGQCCRPILCWNSHPKLYSMLNRTNSTGTLRTWSVLSFGRGQTASPQRFQLLLGSRGIAQLPHSPLCRRHICRRLGDDVPLDGSSLQQLGLCQVYFGDVDPEVDIVLQLDLDLP